MSSSLVEYALRLGDDALISAQRLAEWSSRAPDLEEDIALTNLGLDLLGQARSLLGYAGEVEGAGRGEDDLAFLRDERQFRNCQLVELPNGDFAETLARLLYFASYQVELYGGLCASTDATLAAVAGKALPEVRYHREHAVLWTLRLGDGTAESRRRMQRGLDRHWPFTYELFESDPTVQELAGAGLAVDPATLRPRWQQVVASVIERATCTLPVDSGWRPTGGRRGRHTEEFGHLLPEMQRLHRAHPGAHW